MSLPQIVGFGAHKAGTTWLSDNLSQNPGLWRAPLKEMHFFNHADSGEDWMVEGHLQKIRDKKWEFIAKGAIERAMHIDRLLKIPILSEAWYHEIYRACPKDRQSMDITPAYAMLSDDGLRYMGQVLGEKFVAIYLIRDPVERAISAIKSKALTVDAYPDSIGFWRGQAQHQHLQQRSDYRTTIERLDRMLGKRVLYLPFGGIKHDPVGLLRQVERHADLPEGVYPKAAVARHVSPPVVVPEGVRDLLSQMLAPQYAYLESRFSSEFLRQI